MSQPFLLQKNKRNATDEAIVINSLLYIDKHIFKEIKAKQKMQPSYGLTTESDMIWSNKLDLYSIYNA